MRVTYKFVFKEVLSTVLGNRKERIRIEISLEISNAPTLSI